MAVLLPDSANETSCGRGIFILNRIKTNSGSKKQMRNHGEIL